MKELYAAKYELYLPKSYHVKGDVKTRGQWLGLMPNTMHSKFSEWFEKTK